MNWFSKFILNSNYVPSIDYLEIDFSVKQQLVYFNTVQSSGVYHDLVFSNVDANASVQVLASFAGGLFDRRELKGHLTRIYFSSTLNFTSGLYSKFMVHSLRSEGIITSYGILNILPHG